MGIAGTEVAKEASAIILLDDNFSSIVKAIMWGRSVNDAVSKFLQFQITVNITAVVLAFISAVSSSDFSPVLSAVQLLWVNLIMDTFAALALATDAPTEKILNRKPTPKSAPLITTNMWKMIIGQAVYQLAVTFTLYFAGFSFLGYQSRVNAMFPGSKERSDLDSILHTELKTIVFNTFVWMQIFNEFNNRRLDNKFNIFEGVYRNWFFIIINCIMVGGQVMIVFVGGLAFSIKRIDGVQWGVCIGCAAPCLLWAVLLRCIPDKQAATFFSFVYKIWLVVARPVLKVLTIFVFQPVGKVWTTVIPPLGRFVKRNFSRGGGGENIEEGDMELKSTSSALGLGWGSSPVSTDEEVGVIIVVPDENPEISDALTKKETSVGGAPPMSSSSPKEEYLPGITLTIAS